MMKWDSSNYSRSRLSRRSLLQSTAATLLTAPFISTSALAQDKLAGSGEVVVFSYGGTFTEGVRKHVYEPFTKATGIKVIDVVGDFAESQVKAMNQAGRIDWDIAYIDNYQQLHDAGMFVPIDYSLWEQESLEGTPMQARLNDAVAIFGVAMLLAYDHRAFPKGGPQNWADFWDVKNFPGPRGLFAPNAPRNIVFALLADGVANKDIWPLTDDKIDRGLAKLSEIKPHITKWWTAGGEAPQLLTNREYAISSVYDGRVLSAIRQGAPIKLAWDGAALGYVNAAILKGGPNTQNAQKLIAFLNRAPIAAGWTQGTGYPGPNANQVKYLPPEMLPLINISPENAPKCVMTDSAWLEAKRPDGKTNSEYIQERWLAWRAR
ncbi:ABC transporter substrate-binding protein [Bradyrhizobium sp. 23]|uniref:ABC transporter substrate-binding protein n=1 Tax=Bradyrhizobium sp. 23 TaxID=2782667 RepID=UPI001FFA89B0|nr:ABC transporter substrate-binding protein [Bradyrhizobium sp. 23]MCK1315930.1 ABC transporter substrate-binding protein [Bradyrhizobium sp. 23]